MTEHLIQDLLGELTPVHRGIAPRTLYVSGDVELVRESPKEAVVGVVVSGGSFRGVEKQAPDAHSPLSKPAACSSRPPAPSDDRNSWSIHHATLPCAASPHTCIVPCLPRTRGRAMTKRLTAIAGRRYLGVSIAVFPPRPKE